MEEHAAWALALLAGNAQTIAMAEFAALVIGGVWSVLTFFALRRERRRAEKRHVELLQKMDEMIGKPPAEQRRIVRAVRHSLKVKFAEGIAVGESFQAELVRKKAKDG